MPTLPQLRPRERGFSPFSQCVWLMPLVSGKDLSPGSGRERKECSAILANTPSFVIQCWEPSVPQHCHSVRWASRELLPWWHSVHLPHTQGTQGGSVLLSSDSFEPREGWELAVPDLETSTTQLYPQATENVGGGSLRATGLNYCVIQFDWLQ